MYVSYIKILSFILDFILCQEFICAEFNFNQNCNFIWKLSKLEVVIQILYISNLKVSKLGFRRRYETKNSAEDLQ